jgi:hypothetical protein
MAKPNPLVISSFIENLPSEGNYVELETSAYACDPDMNIDFTVKEPGATLQRWDGEG